MDGANWTLRAAGLFAEEDILAGLDVCAQGDGGLPVVVGGHVEFGAAAEGDHAEALAAGELFAGGEGGDDAAGDGAGDLFDDGEGDGVLSSEF